jgi:hypothetical protein
MNVKFLEYLVIPLFVLALPYFIGFIYLQSYYRYFGFTISELNISDREVYVASFFAIANLFKHSTVVERDASILVVPFLGLSIYLIVKNQIPSLLQFLESKLVLITIFFIFIVAAYSSSSRIGLETASSQSGRLPRVYVVDFRSLSGQEDMNQIEQIQLLKSNADFLVYANTTDIFLLRRMKRNADPISVRIKKSENFILFTPKSFK